MIVSVGKVDRLVDAGCLHVCERRDTYGSVSGDGAVTGALRARDAVPMCVAYVCVVDSKISECSDWLFGFSSRLSLGSNGRRFSAALAFGSM